MYVGSLFQSFDTTKYIHRNNFMEETGPTKHFKHVYNHEPRSDPFQDCTPRQLNSRHTCPASRISHTYSLNTVFISPSELSE